ncbi:MAG: hypothetical protein M1819_001948 [Sarea resinae]|nr:MAG: hypothetical protein M1819_001948 [Sarea resinae]
MGKIVITGVDGNLIGYAAELVLQEVPGDRCIFTSPALDSIPAARVQAWKDKGVEVLALDYDNVAGMEKAFKDADVVQLVSTWMIGSIRRAQHRRAVSAAKAAGAKRVLYTSFIGAGAEVDTPYVASDHRDTEQAVYESGLAWNIQRNNLYLDTHVRVFVPAAANKLNNTWPCNCGRTKASYVARQDCSRVAAALILGKCEPNRVYTVTGPELLSDQDIFDLVKQETGWEGKSNEMSDTELYAYWKAQGVPLYSDGDFSKAPIPHISATDLTENWSAVRKGFHSFISDDYEKLTGKKPVSAIEVIRQFKDELPKKA